jgi:transcriptional regulator with XRE-family HTH domain
MPAATAQTFATEESFGPRLRRERERRRIALSSIAENSKISVSLFEELERDDVSKWPSGIFRRSFIRAYAQALGMDADATTREFLERFPDLNDPDRAIAQEAPPAPTSALRLTLASESMFKRSKLLCSIRDRFAAILCDMAIVATLGLAMYGVLGSFWMPLCIALVGYYAGGVLILGNTPGVCLCAPGVSRAHTVRAVRPRGTPARARTILLSLLKAVH